MEGPQIFPVWGALPLPAIHQVLLLSSFNFPCYSDLKKVNRNFNAHTPPHTHPHIHTYIHLEDWEVSRCRRHKKRSIKTQSTGQQIQGSSSNYKRPMCTLYDGGSKLLAPQTYNEEQAKIRSGKWTFAYYDACWDVHKIFSGSQCLTRWW